MDSKPCSLTAAKVVFIGAGPGEADLITVRGSRLLAQAQVVLYDALADPTLRDLAPHADWIDVGKRGFSGKPGSDFNGQTRINRLLIEQSLSVGATHGARGLVARLKGGDPSLFGRLEEELHALRDAGIACEVVPGVTSALAAAAATLRPLTRRGSGRSVSFTTAMTRTGDLQCGMGPGQRADTEVRFVTADRVDARPQAARIGRGIRPAGEEGALIGKGQRDAQVEPDQGVRRQVLAQPVEHLRARPAMARMDQLGGIIAVMRQGDGDPAMPLARGAGPVDRDEMAEARDHGLRRNGRVGASTGSA